MITSIFLRSFLGFLFGVCLFPFLIGVVGIYGALIAGVDPLFGDIDKESFLFVGYVLSAEDVSEINRVSKILNDLAIEGVKLGLALASIGAVSACIDCSKR